MGIRKKTFEEFISTIKRTNIKPSYYYTDYQRVAEHLENFKYVISKFKEINSKENFIEQFSQIVKEDPTAIRITPLFTGVRPDQLIVLDDDGKHVEKFNEDNVSLDEAIEFLDEVGFLERIDENTPFNISSYFFGVNVGLDSNGRKNRGGKQMEHLVGTYVKPLGLEFLEQAKLKDVNAKWGTKFSSTKKKEKKFDFVIKKEEKFIFIETNFFNTSGSKTDINTRFSDLQTDIKSISKECEFIVITDGKGLLKAKTEIEDVFNSIEHVYNIDDLQNGILEKI